MFLGKLTPRKRVDVLVRAFAQLQRRDAWLVIAGNDMGAGGDTRSLVRSLGLEARTVFTGLLRGQERLDALADADVVVYPSQDEVFGLVPLEALLSGTPVIVAGDSGCGEIVSQTGGGQVVPLGDVDALARAIGGDAGRARPIGVRRRGRRRAGSRRHSARTSCARGSRSCTAKWSWHRDGRRQLRRPRAQRRRVCARGARVDRGPGRRPAHGDHRRRRSQPGRFVGGAAPACRRLAAADRSGRGRGAAAAINTGVRAARFPIICQVDQDVVLRPGWMRRLLDELDDPAVGAVQGCYVSDPDSTLCARAMGLDLEQRYAAIAGRETTHVCTGNAAYRAKALRKVGLLDETFGYGYDNDLSYRLRAAGYRLIFCREAQSVHRWREGLIGYLGQQYGFGYGRIDLVAKHPGRIGGDSVSPAGMMSHPLLMAIAVLARGDCGAGRRRRLAVAAFRDWRGDARRGPCARAAGGRHQRGAPLRHADAARVSRFFISAAIWRGSRRSRCGWCAGYSGGGRVRHTACARERIPSPQTSRLAGRYSPEPNRPAT